MAEKMHARDAIYGSLAEAFMTIEGKRHNMMQLTEFDSSIETKTADVAILGQVNKGHKPAGSNGKWSAKAYYNQSVMRRIALKYQNSGYMPYFDIQVSNWDETSEVGRQTVILRDCLCDKFTLAKFATGDNVLSEDLSGTFERFEMPEEFTQLKGMT